MAAGRKLQDKVNKSTSGLTEDAKEVAKKAITTTKDDNKKPASAYLKLDLRPSSCPKLKDYIYEQALKLSVQEGYHISSSAYIQRVLIADKEAKEGKKNNQSRFDDIMVKLESMDKADLKLLRQILDKF